MKRAALLLCLAAAGPAQAQELQKASPAVLAVMPDAIEWIAAPPALPAGARVALLQGDPNLPGPFVVRMVFPAGYRIAPHSHPSHENVTVLRGTLHVGMGDTFDEASTQSLAAGSFAVMPAGMSHYIWVDTETELQIHGTGPFTVNYVKPDDDPRRKTP